MGKDKKDKKEKESGDTSVANISVNDANDSMAERQLSYDEKLQYVSIIASPMASKKLAKKLYKCIKKGVKHKTYIRNGLKDVQARIRKGERGIVVFAGDVTPIDVMCHLPAVCEDKNLPYVYTPSRQDLGNAMGVKRGTLMIMIREHEDYKELYDECKGDIESLPLPIG